MKDVFKKIINFIKYHNAFTIIFVMVFFGSGIVFAASPEARANIYSVKEATTTVDNKVIVSANLDNLNFNLIINTVTEDEKNYYATYSYQTLAIIDGVWQNKEINEVLTVNKKALGEKDLGLYVAKELGENMNYELSYLKRVQKLEIEKGESKKIVTREYSGLVGRLLNPKNMVIEGYEPVMQEPVEKEPVVAEIPLPYLEPQENPGFIEDGFVKPPLSGISIIIAPETEPFETILEPVVEATSTPELAPAESAVPAQEPNSVSVPEPVAPIETLIPEESTSSTFPEPVVNITSTIEIVPVEPATETTSTPELAPVELESIALPSEPTSPSEPESATETTSTLELAPVESEPIALPSDPTPVPEPEPATETTSTPAE